MRTVSLYIEHPSYTRNSLSIDLSIYLSLFYFIKLCCGSMTNNMHFHNLQESKSRDAIFMTLFDIAFVRRQVPDLNNFVRNSGTFYGQFIFI